MGDGEAVALEMSGEMDAKGLWPGFLVVARGWGVERWSRHEPVGHRPDALPVRIHDGVDVDQSAASLAGDTVLICCARSVLWVVDLGAAAEGGSSEAAEMRAGRLHAATLRPGVPACQGRAVLS